MTNQQIPRSVQQALEAPGCERIKDFYAVGPVQRAAVESFAEALFRPTPSTTVEAHRTDREIVEQTEELALWLLSWAFNHKPETSTPMRDSTHPFAERCWNAACCIQELLTSTDPENAVANLDVDAALPPQVEQAPQPAQDVNAEMLAAIEFLLDVHDESHLPEENHVYIPGSFKAAIAQVRRAMYRAKAAPPQAERVPMEREQRESIKAANVINGSCYSYWDADGIIAATEANHDIKAKP